MTYCHPTDKDNISTDGLMLSRRSRKLIAKVVSVLIPSTSTLGAIDLNIDSFVIKMINDCYSNGDQRKFLAGLSAIQNYAKAKFSKSFHQLSVLETEHILNDFEELNGTEEASSFTQVDRDHSKFTYTMVKRHTIQGYLQSEYIMTNILPHTMIPGKFKGCVELGDSRNIQAIIA